MNKVTFTVTINSDDLEKNDLQDIMDTLLEEIQTICEDTSCMLNTNLDVSFEKGN